MKLLHDLNEWPQDGAQPVCAAVGFFDGVHLGHQQVIRQAVADADQWEAKAVVITFDRHPATVVNPERAPGLIYDNPQKLRVIAGLGVGAAILLRFDTAFSQQPAPEFIRNLARHLNPLRSVCVGGSFKFGHQRAGNVDLLQTLGAQLHFAVHGLAAVALDGQTVSSTRIRQAIAEGRLDDAGQMLGRPYTLAGRVVRGDRLGHSLGFPTANIDIAGRVIPPPGVYAVHACTTEHPKPLRAVLNIGRRPTLALPAPQLRAEAHLLDFEGDLYDRELELTLVRPLREERKFTSLDALRDQIGRDIDAARLIFAGLESRGNG